MPDRLDLPIESSTQLTQQIWKLCELASHPNKVLVLRGYQTSQGEVQDLEGQAVGLRGYVELVQEALKQLDENRRELQGQFPADEIVKAVEEQRASYQKTIDRYLNHGQNPIHLLPRHSDIELANQGAGVRLHHFLASRISVTETVDSRSAPKRASAMKTIIKARLREIGPLGHYKGQLVIVPGKVESIEVR